MSGGQSGQNADSGGGSGGSIHVVTTNFSGHGDISVEGGGGIGHGYAGSGGRVAVRVLWYREYSGTFTPFGGFGGALRDAQSPGNGAGGTVYYTDTSSGLTTKELINTTEGIIYKDGFTKLYIDNDNREHNLPSVIQSESGDVFEFDELEAVNHAALQMQGGSKLIVHKFVGDRTGLLHVLENQTVYSEYVASTTGYTVAPVSYTIEAGSEIVLPSTVILLGTRTTVKGLLTGVHNLTVAEGASVEFHSTAQTALLENDTYAHKTKPGNVSVSIFTVQRLSLVELTHIETELRITVDRLIIKYQGEMRVNQAALYSDIGIIESEAVLNLDYRGFAAESGPGAGSSGIGSHSLMPEGYGASHGGHGGIPQNRTKSPAYDSVYEPKQRGSGGGNGDGSGGRGGGYAYWKVGKVLHLDGLIAVRGERGSGSNVGGGSGGGVLIETLNFTGFGQIHCGGGDGAGYGGGGGGGRIAMHIRFANKFSGDLIVFGGSGSNGLPSGAAGTVYVEETNRGPQYADVKYVNNVTYVTATHRRLEINNNDLDFYLYRNHGVPWLYSVLNEGDSDHYEFDEAMLSGHSNMLLDYPTGKDSVTVVIHKFLGDRTGLVHLRAKQVLYVEVVESQSNETMAPCSFKIDPDSEILFPETAIIVGTRTYLGGRITGVQHLYIQGGGDVVFLSTAQTAIIENGTYVMISPKGNFTFATVTVMRKSIGEFRDIDDTMSITSSHVRIKYEGLFLMNKAELFSTNAYLESRGILDMNAVGGVAETGLGAGSSVGGVGLGAGHGGYGGGAGPQYGGVPYNSLYLPTELGSGGGQGSGIGGSGGGLLMWHVADIMEMDGELTLRGGSGLGTDAGGGSGGSVVIEVTNITGHGLIAVNGGHGTGRGGGGAGGRIAILCRYRYQYGGLFHNFGGGGEGSHRSSHAGASGTTYVEENLRPLQYRLTKYNPVKNTTFLSVDHTYVHADNIGQYSPAPTLIMENFKYEYEFDELDLTGSARLMIYHPDNATEVKATVHRFIGDKTGQLHLRINQTVYVEYVESETNRTEAPCGYIIEDGAEIVLPSEFHMHGTNSTLAGKITGVHELFIEAASMIQFMSTANTALLENGTYFRITAPGNFAFDSIIVKQGGLVLFKKITSLMKVECSELKVMHQGVLFMNDAELYSTYAWVESEGIFHLDGAGYSEETGPGAGVTINDIGSGAGHGGYGGGTSGGQPYDSVFGPSQLGSGGGNGQGMGGSGGGLLFWKTSHYMELNGLLSLKGLDGTGHDSGGGSGGSILIETTNITGHGEISVRGGNGQGGGAAGGRIGIQCQFRYSFGGKFTNRGGEGNSSSDGAAAGTTFVKNNMRPLEYRILKYLKGTNISYFEVDHIYVHADNEGYLVPVATMVMQSDTVEYEFDEMEVTGDARVIFYHPANSNVTVTIHRLMGDRTGRLHLRSHQRVLVEVVESMSNVTEAPCSFVIDYEAEMLMPTEVHLQGTNTNIEGMLTGVHHIYIEDKAFVSVAATSQTALIENGTYVSMTEEGNFSLPSINIKRDGVLEFRRIIHDITVTTAFLEIKYQGKMLLNHGYVDAGDVDIESEGSLNLDARGHPPSMGPGASSADAGGSYGGIGGGLHQGAAYGSLFTPHDLGSGGSGASGGGFIEMRVGRLIHLDGSISSRGGDSDIMHAAGGSGGSILIKAYNFSGQGVLDASGGMGRDNAGSGSGGRIAAHIGYQNIYGGKYLAHGGVGENDHYVNDGGPGTVYKYESQRGPQYRELKYNPRLNSTEVKPEHSKLLVENAGLNTSNPAVAMENNSVYYEFDEVQVEGYAYVHFYHPIEARNVSILVHEITGNRKGLIRVQIRQQLVVEFVKSTHTYLDAPCGFHIDRGGEVLLPTTFIILTNKVILGGRMSGVEELVIHAGGELILIDSAHTGDEHSLDLWYNEVSSVSYTPGALTIANVTISNQGQLTMQTYPIQPVLNTGYLTVKNGGLVAVVMSGTLQATVLEIELGALVEGDARGYGRMSGPGAGTTHVSGSSGGGYASEGKKV